MHGSKLWGKLEVTLIGVAIWSLFTVGQVEEKLMKVKNRRSEG